MSFRWENPFVLIAKQTHVRQWVEKTGMAMCRRFRAGAPEAQAAKGCPRCPRGTRPGHRPLSPTHRGLWILARHGPLQTVPGLFPQPLLCYFTPPVARNQSAPISCPAGGPWPPGTWEAPSRPTLQSLRNSRHHFPSRSVDTKAWGSCQDIDSDIAGGAHHPELLPFF